jgi:hypothetical protein
LAFTDRIDDFYLTHLKSIGMLRQVRDIIPLIWENENIMEPEGTLPAKAEQSFDWYHNALRDHSIEAIQSALAKGLAELTGQRYEMKIIKLDFAPPWGGINAELSGHAEIVMRVSKVDSDASSF